MAWQGQQYTLSQDVAIPADVASATLVTHHRIRYGAGNLRQARPHVPDRGLRSGRAMVRRALRASRSVPAAAGMDFGWIRREFDLSAYAGQTVRIRFTEIIPESYTGPAILELDDISLTYVAAEPKSPLSVARRTELALRASADEPSQHQANHPGRSGRGRAAGDVLVTRRGRPVSGCVSADSPFGRGGWHTEVGTFFRE